MPCAGAWNSIRSEQLRDSRSCLNLPRSVKSPEDRGARHQDMPAEQPGKLLPQRIIERTNSEAPSGTSFMSTWSPHFALHCFTPAVLLARSCRARDMSFMKPSLLSACRSSIWPLNSFNQVPTAHFAPLMGQKSDNPCPKAPLRQTRRLLSKLERLLQGVQERHEAAFRNVPGRDY